MGNNIPPDNKLEKILLNSKPEDLKSFDKFITFFLKSEIIVPSYSKIFDGNFDPLIFRKNDHQMIACFTSKKLLELYKNKISQFMELKGRDILEQVPGGYGIVINPGYDFGFDIEPEGIKQLLYDFKR